MRSEPMGNGGKLTNEGCYANERNASQYRGEKLFEETMTNLRLIGAN